MALHNLTKRVLFAVVAVPISWVVINSGPVPIPQDIYQAIFGPSPLLLYPFQILTFILIFLAVHEYNAMVAKKLGTKNGFWLSNIWISFQGYAYFNTNTPSAITSMYLLLIIVAAEAIIWGSKTQRWNRVSLFFSGNIFLYICMVSIFELYNAPAQQIFIHPENIWLSQIGIVGILSSIFLCDTAAYFTGKFFGKHSFSSISPNKTIEGAIGGFVTAVFVSSLNWYFFSVDRYSLLWGILLGVIIGVFAQAGDLLASLIKRNFEVKDSGSLIPGHGGILDRFDSVFFTAPAILLFFWFFEMVNGV